MRALLILLGLLSFANCMSEAGMVIAEGRVSPEQSGEWLLRAVRQEGALAGDVLTDDDVRMLKTPIPNLLGGGVDLEHFRRLNNKVVRLARSAMERSKATGAPTTEARRNLRIPTDWFEHYTVIYTSNLDWALSGALQNAMMANPFAGETSPWESR